MGARIDGIDLSHWQSGDLDFRAAKHAGVRFVCHKATESVGYVDPFHDRRRRETRDAGLVFGSYHFARPADSSGATQARHFLAHASAVNGDLLPMLDLEDQGGLARTALTHWVADFTATVRAQTGAGSIIYTRFDLDDHHDAPLWVARYSDAMSAPVIPAPWKSYTIWQFSDGRYGNPKSVPGIGHCDINTLNTKDPAGLLQRLLVGGTQEDDMTPEQEKTLRSISADVNALRKALAAFREAELGRDQKLLQRVNGLADTIADSVVAAVENDQAAGGGVEPGQLRRTIRSEVIAGVRDVFGELADQPAPKA